MRSDIENPNPDPPSSNTVSTPPKAVRLSRSNKNNESPGVQTVLSDTTQPVTINHSFSHETKVTGRNGTAKTLLGMSKPAMAIVGVLLFGTVGAGLLGWLQIPGLNKQIRRLEKQVDRLSAENDRYEALNNELNQTVVELEGVKDKLKIEVESLQSEVGRLGVVVNELSIENDRFRQINGYLNSTVTELQGVNSGLNKSVAELTNSVTGLNMTVLILNEQNQVLSGENDRFRELNGQLSTITSFLNETTAGLNSSYETLTRTLAEQIIANRVLLLLNMETSYQTKLDRWDCSYRDRFRGQPFVTNEDAPIGLASVGTVYGFVEEKILSEVCADTSDFTRFVSSKYGQETMTSNQLYQGVEIYIGALLNYYFPDSGESGLTQQDWASANYDCANVPKFAYTGGNPSA